MSDHDAGPPPSDLQGLFDAERSAPDMPREARGRVLGRLEASIAAGAATMAATQSGHAAAHGTARAAGRLATIFSKPLVVGLASFVAGAAAGIGIYASVRSAPRERVVVVTHEVRVPVVSTAPPVDPQVATRPPVPIADTPPLLQVTGIADAGAREPATIHRPVTNTAGVGGSELDRERAALDTARTAVLRNQPAAALTILERSAREFPHGQLADERDAIIVQALVAQGRFDQARERAAEFDRAHPGSMLRAAVRQALSTIP